MRSICVPFVTDFYALPDVQVVSMAQVRNTIVSLVKSAKVIVFAIAAITLAGMLGGLLPAARAARIRPLEALRSESV